MADFRRTASKGLPLRPWQVRVGLLGHAFRAVVGKLGRFQRETFSETEIFLPGRDTQSVHLKDSRSNSCSVSR